MIDIDLKIAFAGNILNVCGADKNSSIYSLLPLIDKEPFYFKGVYAYSLANVPKMIDCAIEIFTNQRMDVAKSSYEYNQILKEKDNLISYFSKSMENSCDVIKINNNKVLAALALLSHIYLESFTRPVQFFLPNSSICSGEWKLWDEIEYFNLIERTHDKSFIEKFKKQILKNGVWISKMEPEDFPLIVRRRLVKENSFNEKFSPESMIKAIIIQLGKKAKPHINYEVVDFSIRSFFTYLSVDKYLRVDREIEFLRRLDKEIVMNLRD